MRGRAANDPAPVIAKRVEVRYGRFGRALASSRGGTVAFGVVSAVQVGEQANQSVTAARNCAKSAVLVPVPEAEHLVGAWRAVHDPSARTGVPAHITLVVPWIPPDQISPEHLEQLEKLLFDWGPFEYSLDQVCWFGQRVLWLSPTPAGPFKRLTAELADHFDTPPWQGEFSEVVPHLTVGLAGYALGCTLSEAAEDLASKLPVRCRAREVDVMCGDGVQWAVVHRVVLQAGQVRASP